MRKLLITVLLFALALVAAPAAAQTAYAPTPQPGARVGTGPRAGEVALGSFVAPIRSTARHGAATSFKAGEGCSIQCITGGVAYGRGPDARLVVTTDSPATIRIVVSRSGYYQQIVSDPGTTSFSADLDDLEADTHYDAFVSAVDGAGHMANRSGSFTTLQRNVHLVFNEADIDEAPYGDDPFYAQFWFEGEASASVPLGDADGGELHLGAQAFHEDDTDRYLSAAVELTQSDESVDLCEAESDPDEPEAGHGSCDYSATAWLADGAFDLDHRPSGAAVNDYWIGGTMVLPNGVDDPALPGGFGSPLSFSVQVGIRVTFT
ncbi:MAG TPA: hypothetical protein VGO60_18105 [Iamia sp.]|jgi:hypothetical protein|nr:hypothetical protein [Iamia sp.]